MEELIGAINKTERTFQEQLGGEPFQFIERHCHAPLWRTLSQEAKEALVSTVERWADETRVQQEFGGLHPYETNRDYNRLTQKRLAELKEYFAYWDKNYKVQTK